ncbi:MAG: hypothetical protein K8F26_06460 [Thiobacillus sp.]|jgi:hypothetical protein|nr:hypothetical protein [Thiobacillus sp.]
MALTDWTLMVATFAVIWLIALWPLLFPLFLAVRSGKHVQRRWLFVLGATCLSYGFFLLLVIAFWLPLEFLTSIWPQLAFEAPQFTSLAGPLVDFAHAWFKFLPFLMLVAFASISTRWLWLRWPRFAEVINDR